LPNLSQPVLQDRNNLFSRHGLPLQQRAAWDPV
jgi:hypothetical protein